MHILFGKFYNLSIYGQWDMILISYRPLHSVDHSDIDVPYMTMNKLHVKK